MRICLSAGHYPKKPGARNTNYDVYEHDVAVPIVSSLSERLHLDGHDVMIVHGTLTDKVKRINGGLGGEKFDIAWDVHFNAFNRKQEGTMVMHFPNSDKRKAQAADMSHVIASSLHTKDKGARPALYWGGTEPGTKPDYFTDKTNCPAFIPEPGYIDNDAFCEKFLTSQEGLDSVVDALYEAMKSYEEKYHA